MIVAAILPLAALSFGGEMAIEPSTPPKQLARFILPQEGDVDGVGFGLDVCPISCKLLQEPMGSGDPDPCDTPDSPGAVTRTWTNDIVSEFLTNTESLAAVLMLKAAGIQSDILPSVPSATTTAVPLFYYNQREYSSGLIPIQLAPEDFAEGLF
jgi:hypothetical protein